MFEFELPYSGIPDENFKFDGQVNYRVENGPQDLLHGNDLNDCLYETKRFMDCGTVNFDDPFTNQK